MLKELLKWEQPHRVILENSQFIFHASRNCVTNVKPDKSSIVKTWYCKAWSIAANWKKSFLLNWKKFDIAIGSSLSIKNKKKEKEKFKILFAYYCEAKEKNFFDELKKIITKLCPLLWLQKMK